LVCFYDLLHGTAGLTAFGTTIRYSMDAGAQRRHARQAKCGSTRRMPRVGGYPADTGAGRSAPGRMLGVGSCCLLAEAALFLLFAAFVLCWAGG
jgi:hypothetical protein